MRRVFGSTAERAGLKEVAGGLQEVRRRREKPLAEGPRPRRRGPRAVVRVTTPVGRGSRRSTTRRLVTDEVQLRAMAFRFESRRRTALERKRPNAGHQQVRVGDKKVRAGCKQVRTRRTEVRNTSRKVRFQSSKGPIRADRVPATTLEGFFATQTAMFSHIKEMILMAHTTTKQQAPGRSQPAQEGHSRR